jgi:hypothetical protein
MHIVSLSETSITICKSARSLVPVNANSSCNLVLYEMKESYLRLWSAVDVKYFICIEIKQCTCSCTRSMNGAIVHAKCSLRKTLHNLVVQKHHI